MTDKTMIKDTVNSSEQNASITKQNYEESTLSHATFIQLQAINDSATVLNLHNCRHLTIK